MTGGSGRKLFVGGLPNGVDEGKLQSSFERFWQIDEGMFEKYSDQVSYTTPFNIS